MKFIIIMISNMNFMMNFITHDEFSSWITMGENHDEFHHDFHDEIHDEIHDEFHYEIHT